MIICHSHKFIFIKTMKTAGTSLELALARACGPQDIVAKIVPPEAELEALPQINFKNAVFQHPKTGKRRVIRQHSGLIRAIEMFGSDLKDYRVITSERNPWDKLVSSFYWKLHQTPEQVLDGPQPPSDLSPEETQRLFRRFVLSPVKDPCEAFDMYSHQWVPLVDHLIRFENLEEDLQSVVDAIGLPGDVKLSRKRSKSGIRPKNVKTTLTFDEEMDKAVRLRFAREIANFGYSSQNSKAPPYVAPDWRGVWRSAAFKN